MLLLMGIAIETFVVGASIFYTEACIALPMRGCLAASLPTRNFRLDNSFSLNMALYLLIRRRSRVFCVHGRRIFQNTTCVLLAMFLISYDS